MYKLSIIYVVIRIMSAYHTTRSASDADYFLIIPDFITDYYCYFTVPKMAHSD